MYISSILLKKFYTDEQQIHVALMSCFDSKREKFNILYKKKIIETSDGDIALSLLVYSDVQPVSSRTADVDVSLFIEPEKSIYQGQALGFSVIANPCRKHNGRKYTISDSGERCEWVIKKMSEGGADVMEKTLQEKKLPTIHLEHSYGKSFIPASCFTGVLRVTDLSKFLDLFHKGLGSAKAYGCGLLELRG